METTHSHQEAKVLQKVYFSDIFNVNHSIVEKYGALDISLICDNPAFVDPFLIFANVKYKKLHDLIIDYLKFLRELSIKNNGNDLSSGDFKHYYKFPEVKQVWLGYSLDGNGGLGLGRDFAKSLHKNLNEIFSGFGKEKITETAHLEKLCLVESGIGVDKISDFTLNLVKIFFLEYTEVFAQKYIDKKLIYSFAVKKARFDFKKQLWQDETFSLPFINVNGKKEFILLVPKDIVTKHDNWISKNDFLNNDASIFNTIDNDELRTKINKFFLDNLLTKLNKKKKLEKDFSRKSKTIALSKTVREFPETLDYYIKFKEKTKTEALTSHIADPEIINHFEDTSVLQKEFSGKNFGKLSSFDDCVSRIVFFKATIESNSNKLYIKGKPLEEKHLQLMFKMVTFDSLFDYNSEVNNGRGPIDFVVSYGSNDKTGLELKRASNTKLKKNLQNQGDVYTADSNLKHVIKMIFFFSKKELDRVTNILKLQNKIVDNKEIFLIDCRKKDSGSNQG
jgi:hypothetical protein